MAESAEPDAESYKVAEYRVAQKTGTYFVRLITYNLYWAIFRLSPKIPPHLKCVATLACEM